MKKKIITAAKILLSLILLVYLFNIIPFKGIIASFRHADLELVLLGIILAAPISYLSALETSYLTKIQGINLSVNQILKIHLATGFYSLFLPGTLSGGAVKWYKLSRYGSKSSAAAVVVFNRFLETLIVIFAGIIFSFAAFGGFEGRGAVIGLLLILSLMILLYMLLLNKSVLDFTGKIILGLPLPLLIKKLSEKFRVSMLCFGNLSLKVHFKIFGLLFLYHGIGIISFYCFAKSLDINLSIWTIGWVRSAMILAIMLPLSFAGLGIREGTLVVLLSQYGIKPETAMAFSFLFFSRNILTALLGGLIEFKEQVISKKVKEKNSVRRSGTDSFLKPR